MKACLLAVLLFSSHALFANQACEELFQPVEFSQNFNLQIQQIHKCYYKERYCGDNIYKLATQLKKLVTNKEALKTAEVYFLFDPQFEKLRPHKKILPNQKGWDYHVVLKVGDRILDLDDPLSKKGKPLLVGEYFTKYFENDLNTMRVIRIPYEHYIEDLTDYNVDPGEGILSPLAVAPMGWVRPYVQKYGRPHLSRFRYAVNYWKGLPYYYLTSKDSYKKYPPISLPELLQ